MTMTQNKNIQTRNRQHNCENEHEIHRTKHANNNVSRLQYNNENSRKTKQHIPTKSITDKHRT